MKKKMRGEKRKRKRKETFSPERVSRSVRSKFTNMVESVKQGHERNENSRTIRDKFSSLVNSSRNERQVENTSLPIRGQEKGHLSLLENHDDYVRPKNQATRGVDFLIRKSGTIVADSLFMKETKYDIEVRTSGEMENLTIAGFIGNLWDVVDTIYSDCIEMKEFDEICIHATHRELEGSLSSSIYELTEDNRNRLIYELMSRITGWNQSSKPDAAVKHLSLSVTLLKRNIPGNGVLLAIGDDNLRRKAFSKNNFNGSILYVDTEDNCFFVSIYLVLAYNRYNELFKNAVTLTEKKRIHSKAFELFELKGKNLEEAAKDFFDLVYNLKIENFESGSTSFLKELTRKSSSQVSVFSDEKNYKRILMVPEEYDPLLAQVNILLTQYLVATEPRKTVRKESEFARYHYHGIRTTCRGFVGQNLSFCVYCGVYHSYKSAFHYCKKGDLLCDMCLRPMTSLELYREMTDLVKTNFCYQPSESVMKDCDLGCKICKKEGKTTLCLELHKQQRCKQKVRCSECNRVIHLTGKYTPKTRNATILKHESCEEVFCHLCNDYVLGFDDLKKPSHVCYVPIIKKVKKWPSLIVCFDFETFPCDSEGTMKANLVHLMYQSERNNACADFKGIFFTDVPMEDVRLNNQVVKPGVEYNPEVTEDLQDYYPYEVLKKSAEGVTGKMTKKFLDFQRAREDSMADSRLGHFLRHPDIPNLSLTSKVQGHLDVFGNQEDIDYDNILEEDPSDLTDEEPYEVVEQEKRKSKKVDWRQELKKLEKEDKLLVDKMLSAKDKVSEEEAQMEDKLFKERIKTLAKKEKKKRCVFLSEEAEVAEMDKNEESEVENEWSDEEILTDVVKRDKRNYLECEERDEVKEYPSLYWLKPSQETGDVPGNSPRAESEVTDFFVSEMSKEENIQQVLSSCKDPFPNWKGTEDLNLDPTFEKFCEHESIEDYKRRFESYKKSLGEEKSNCLKQFALYILQPKFQNAVFLGMYSSGFDNHFVFLQLMDLGVRVSPVFKGNKLLTFSIPALNIRFLDFFCYVPSSLKNLEKSFNLKTGSKGFFPHLLNQPANYGLVLPHLPPKHFYEPEMMNKSDLDSFVKWYSENYQKPFKFSQELLSYCEQDVKILMAASLKFVRETLIQQAEFVGKVRVLEPNGEKIRCSRKGPEGDIEPNLVHVFSQGLCTLSSYVNTLFRSYYLQEKTLPIVSHDVEESYSTKSSKVELEALTFIKEVEGVSDLEFGDHYRGQRRFTIPVPNQDVTRTFYVDGYSPKTKTVYEVLGCAFHGCYDCYEAEDKLKNGLLNFEALRITQERIELLKLHREVKHICVVKECEWKTRSQRESRVSDFLKKNKLKEMIGRRMSLKETFRGGLVSRER